MSLFVNVWISSNVRLWIENRHQPSQPVHAYTTSYLEASSFFYLASRIAFGRNHLTICTAKKIVVGYWRCTRLVPYNIVSKNAKDSDSRQLKQCRIFNRFEVGKLSQRFIYLQARGWRFNTAKSYTTAYRTRQSSVCSLVTGRMLLTHQSTSPVHRVSVQYCTVCGCRLSLSVPQD